MKFTFNRKKLQEIRLANNLSLKECALALGTSRQRITSNEEGNTEPRIAFVLQYCNTFGVKPEDFFTEN